MHVNKSTCDRLAPSRFLNILFCCIVILYNHWFLTSVLSSRNTRFSAGEVEGVFGREPGGGKLTRSNCIENNLVFDQY